MKQEEWPSKFSWIVSLSFGIIEIRQTIRVIKNSNERSPPPRKFRVIKEELRFEEVNDQIREKQRDPNLNVQHSRKDRLETSEREDKLFF